MAGLASDPTEAKVTLLAASAAAEAAGRIYVDFYERLDRALGPIREDISEIKVALARIQPPPVRPCPELCQIMEQLEHKREAKRNTAKQWKALSFRVLTYVVMAITGGIVALIGKGIAAR